ncbi:MAG: glycosyltransferase family 2 protein [Vulcanimicrobiota bacterium]
MDGCLSRTSLPSTESISVPRFSVLICTYQRAELLPRAMSSVLQQGFADFELIVVDDGSSDGTKEVVESFQDERILFLANFENRGLARSTNRGFAEATGDFLSILDDDDEFEPTFLEKMDHHLKTTEVDFSWCGVREFPENGKLPKEIMVELKEPDLYSRQMLAVLIGSGFGFTIRRSLLESVGGYDENLLTTCDVDLFLNLVQGPWQWSALPHVLVNVYRQSERLTLCNARRAESLEYIIDKHAPFLSTHPRLKSALYFQLGTVLADAGERLWIRRALGAYLRESPKDVAAWSIWLSSELRHYWFGLKLLQVYRWFYHRYFAPQA